MPSLRVVLFRLGLTHIYTRARAHARTQDAVSRSYLDAWCRIREWVAAGAGRLMPAERVVGGGGVGSRGGRVGVPFRCPPPPPSPLSTRAHSFFSCSFFRAWPPPWTRIFAMACLMVSFTSRVSWTIHGRYDGTAGCLPGAGGARAGPPLGRDGRLFHFSTYRARQQLDLSRWDLISMLQRPSRAPDNQYL